MCVGGGGGGGGDRASHNLHKYDKEFTTIFLILSPKSESDMIRNQLCSQKKNNC